MEQLCVIPISVHSQMGALWHIDNRALSRGLAHPKRVKITTRATGAGMETAVPRLPSVDPMWVMRGDDCAIPS